MFFLLYIILLHFIVTLLQFKLTWYLRWDQTTIKNSLANLLSGILSPNDNDLNIFLEKNIYNYKHTEILDDMPQTFQNFSPQSVAFQSAYLFRALICLTHFEPHNYSVNDSV